MVYQKLELNITKFASYDKSKSWPAQGSPSADMLKRVGDIRKAGIICLFGPVCGHRTIFQNKHTPSLAFDNQIDFVHGFLVYHQFKTNA